MTDRPSRFSRRRGCASPRSADLAGQRVSLSPDIPTAFDAPLASYHKLIGRWAAPRVDTVQRYTRDEVRRRIEREFSTAALDILGRFTLAELRIVVLQGDEHRPPAIAVICDTVGQLEMGWIEKANVLAQTLTGYVAPARWRATAYQALTEALPAALPIFGYDHLFEEISEYYWEGETEDEAAKKVLAHYHGAEDLDDMVLPSDMRGRRPDWMLAENTTPLKQLPTGLGDRIRRLRTTAKALRAAGAGGNAWWFDFNEICEYLPEYDEHAHLPPMTLVCADAFAAELDEVGRFGMERGFMDIAGLCPLTGSLDDWFASFRLGAEVLLAAQDLISLDPEKL